MPGTFFKITIKDAATLALGSRKGAESKKLEVQVAILMQLAGTLLFSQASQFPRDFCPIHSPSLGRVMGTDITREETRLANESRGTEPRQLQSRR